ncbi:HpcH/HpaI aldolase/citrate lyase family protein [Pelagibius sp.]|uniref:HpcH/HpaI aldolase family protein n=1 Tax=Pelagibius sp. TaxID=1931238 RepID=UPI0026067984|nr:aldolase/citrate lyase family protein [Pelagibius sp.]
MIPNAVKQKWAADSPVVNGWLSIASPFCAEIMADQGFDSLTVDVQHGALDYPDLLPMFQAMRASGVVPMARVPWLEAGIIMKALDAGAYGIICPMVNSRKDAEALVSYMRYPPKGTRSFGPTRANFSAGPGYASEANDQILSLAMIETAEAVKNLEEIVSTPGLDGIYIGPADLTLGVTDGRLPPALDREEEEMIEVIRRILEAAHAAGIRAGIHCGGPDYAARAIAWGFDLVTLSNDVRMLAAAAQSSVQRTRELIGGEAAPVAADSGVY